MQPASATIAQSYQLFKPFVTVVMKGAAVAFPNQDNVKHHVYSFSDTKRIDLPL